MSANRLATHTAGPWQFYADLPSTDPNWHIVTNASRLRVVANVHIEPGNAMDLANARLIAAAPELLDFARRVAEYSDYTHDGISERTILHELQIAAQVLLAKAEGRS